MTQLATTAVILARGLGTRMRKAGASAGLSVAQSRAADSGLKSMIPDDRGRPFLDHVLSSLADAGIKQVVLVVAPDHDAIASHYLSNPTRRIKLAFAIQQEPLGTADALLSAEAAVLDDPFLVMNADNLYPTTALRSLVELGEPGLVAFESQGLLSHGNIDADRLGSFALIEIDSDGYLSRLVEKPSQVERMQFGNDALVSMNLWRFDVSIFSACRRVSLSSRGERELPQAVSLAISEGLRIRAVRASAGVLDLSSRADIANVAARLAALPANP
jgi:glucose-1-phosphate thymidylyltransferase